jgi:hypothetical protein
VHDETARVRSLLHVSELYMCPCVPLCRACIQAVLAVTSGRLDAARVCIEEARRGVLPVLASMLRESYR